MLEAADEEQVAACTEWWTRRAARHGYSAPLRSRHGTRRGERSASYVLVTQTMSLATMTASSTARVRSARFGSSHPPRAPPGVAREDGADQPCRRSVGAASARRGDDRYRAANFARHRIDVERRRAVPRTRTGDSPYSTSIPACCIVDVYGSMQATLSGRNVTSCPSSRRRPESRPSAPNRNRDRLGDPVVHDERLGPRCRDPCAAQRRGSCGCCAASASRWRRANV